MCHSWFCSTSVPFLKTSYKKAEKDRYGLDCRAMVSSARNFVRGLDTFGTLERGNQFPDHKENKAKRKKKTSLYDVKTPKP